MGLVEAARVDESWDNQEVNQVEEKCLIGWWTIGVEEPREEICS